MSYSVSAHHAIKPEMARKGSARIRTRRIKRQANPNRAGRRDTTSRMAELPARHGLGSSMRREPAMTAKTKTSAIRNRLSTTRAAMNPAGDRMKVAIS